MSAVADRRSFLRSAARGSARRLAELHRELSEAMAEEQVAGHALVPVPTGPGTPVRAPYWIARAVVSNRQYAAFVAATGARAPSYWSGSGFPDGTGPLPVTCITGSEAKAYCAWCTTQAPGWRFRLPTEIEREHAAGQVADAGVVPAPGEWTSTPAPDDEHGRRCARVHGGRAPARAFDEGHLGVGLRVVAVRRA